MLQGGLPVGLQANDHQGGGEMKVTKLNHKPLYPLRGFYNLKSINN